MIGFSKQQLNDRLVAEDVSEECIGRVLSLEPQLSPNEAFPHLKLIKNTQRTLSIKPMDCEPLMRALSALFNEMDAITQFTEVFSFLFFFFFFHFVCLPCRATCTALLIPQLRHWSSRCTSRQLQCRLCQPRRVSGRQEAHPPRTRNR